MSALARPSLVVRKNAKGRGVYAARAFERGEVVADNPVLVWPVPPRQFSGFLQTPKHPIDDYVWVWPDRRHEALALGLISLFNHSATPNTGSERLFKRRRIVCRALRLIRAGEEILIDYGKAHYDFEVKP